MLDEYTLISQSLLLRFYLHKYLNLFLTDNQSLEIIKYINYEPGLSHLEVLEEEEFQIEMSLGGYNLKDKGDNSENKL
jgi:hypothetical protein